MIIHAIAAVFALTGTLAQAFLALRDAALRDPDVPAALAVDSLRREVRWWQPLRRRNHLRVVAQLMEESPAEAAAYRRVYGTIVAWSALAVAALFALIGAFVV